MGREKAPSSCLFLHFLPRSLANLTASLNRPLPTVTPVVVLGRRCVPQQEPVPMKRIVTAVLEHPRRTLGLGVLILSVGFATAVYAAAATNFVSIYRSASGDC